MMKRQQIVRNTLPTASHLPRLVRGLFRRTLPILILALCALICSRASGQSPVWVQTQLSSRRFAAMAYDPARGITVLFGGLGTVDNNVSKADAGTWEWNGASWTPIPVSGPSARSGAAMVYDSQRGVMVLFGGKNNGNMPNGETWEWNGSAWTQRAVAGPSARSGHAMVYDSARGVTVLFGGNTGGDNGETWEWDGAAWTRRLVTGPVARSLHAMAYDSVRHVTVLFGGTQSNGNTWEWDGVAWTRRMVTEPGFRTNHAMAFDSSRGVTVLFGGFGSSTVLTDTWEWNGVAWTQRANTGAPTGRYSHAMVFDSMRNQAVMFGGNGGSFSYFADTWGINAQGWTQLAQYPPMSVSRSQAAMVFDTSRGVSVLFGGSAFFSSLNGELWETDGTTWTRRQADTAYRLDSLAMAYDSRRAVTVIFGNRDDTLEWNGTALVNRNASGPTQRSYSAMAYDPRRGVVVLFGGESASSVFGDTWEWDGTAWVQRMVGGPTPRSGHTMAYNTVRGVTVMFGGWTGPALTNEIWEWDGTSWTQNTQPGPSARDLHAMTFDSLHGAMMLFGGVTAGGANNGESWKLVEPCARPTVYGQPPSRTACGGGTAGFGVSILGSLPSTFQWQIQTTPGVWQTMGSDPLPLPCGDATYALAAPANAPTTTIGIRACPGDPPGSPQHFQIRCIITNACGNTTSDEATYTICPADFNCSGDVEINDIFVYLNAWFASDEGSDIDGMNGVTIDDIFVYLNRWFAGC